MSDQHERPGLLLSPTKCRITHGTAANIKQPFPDLMPSLVMHELSPSSHTSNGSGFSGQIGFIPFDTSCRLPRHIHMSTSSDRTRFVDERIMILNGVAMVEVAGEYFVVAPGSLVDTVGGVPHTFTACPAGVVLPDGTVSTGTFTMVYEYEEATSFFPTRSTKVVTKVDDYERWDGDLDEIRFPEMTKDEVVQKARGVVWNKEIRKLKVQDS